MLGPCYVFFYQSDRWYQGIDCWLLRMLTMVQQLVLRYILGSLDQPILETKTACYGLDLLNVDIRDPVTDMSANGYIDSQTVSG